MQDLLDRIVAAAPDPLRLTDDEFAQLSAYLQTYRRRVSLSMMQRAQRGDLAAQAQLDQDEKRWSAWRCTLEYNRVLRSARKAAAPAEPPASAGATRKTASAPKADTNADSGQTEDDEGLSPSRIKAKALYDWAMERIAGADKMTRAELFNAILARLDVEIARASGQQAELLADLRDSLPPNAAAFGRYLRDAGVKVYSSKGDRLPGRSIRRRDQF